MAVASRPLVAYSRGGEIESVHRGWLWTSNDPTPAEPYPTVFARSSLKPFQALPLLLSGAADAYGLSDAELTLVCSSHNGQPFQTDVVAALMQRADLPIEALQCGAHPPHRAADADELRRRGETPSALHNNCSGKHAGFLLACRHAGWSLENYLDVDHPLQIQIRTILATLTGLPVESLPPTIDGCSAPTYAMPVDRLGRLFAQLARPTHDDWGPHLLRLGRAIAAHPRHLAGDECFDTDLMMAGPFVCKEGAEAIHAGVHLPSGYAWALKIEDGSKRAIPITITGELAAAGLLDPTLPALVAHRGGTLRNHAGLPVGDVRYLPVGETR